MAKRKSRSRQFKLSSRVIDMDEARQERLEKREAAQAEEIRERTASDERKLRRKRAVRKKQSRRRILVLGVAAFLIVVLCISVVNIIQLKAEERDALKKQEQLKAKQEQMEEELKNSDSEENIEDLAREKLKLTKPGEIIYIPESEEDQ
ncbi:MAG: FtsB family cell division protein [Bacillota bacterium]